jgi:DNA-binding protein
MRKSKMNSLPREPNVIYVGRKPPMNYVLGIITGFSRSNTEEVTLKARGQAITTAVDAAEITRHRFMKNLSIGKITVGTEEMPPREGENRARMVSTIEITLTQAPPAKKGEGEKKSQKTESVASTPPTELTSIEGIGAKSAETLKSCGVSSVQDLANFDPKELSEKLQISEKRVSKWIDEAKKALKQ